MDQKDYQIIRLLQKNGKRSYGDLGRAVDLSVSAVKERVRKLSESGVLKRNVYLLEPRRLGLDICAFVQVLMTSPSTEETFVRTMDRFPEVQECHCISGEYSYLLKVRSADTRALEELLTRIKSVDGVARTNALIVLTSSKETSELDLSPGTATR